MAILATETWTGTNGAAWPAQWAGGITGTGTNKIQSNAGAMAVSAAGVNAQYISTMTAVSAVDYTCTLSGSALAGQAGLSIGTFAGDFFVDSGYTLAVQFANQQLQIYSTDATDTTNTLLATQAFTLVAGTTYNVRLRRVGAIISGKVWTGTEPASWTITATATNVYGTGQVHLSGQSASAVTFTFDNLTVTDATSTPTSITSAAVVPSPTATVVSTVTPTSISTGNVVPSPAVTSILSVSPSSITSGELDPANITVTNVLTVTPTSITSAQSVPSVGVSNGPPTTILAPVSIVSSSAVPSPDAAYMLQFASPDPTASGQQVPTDASASVQQPILVFIPPYIQRRVPILGSLSALMNFGLAVYRINGEWFENEHPSWQELDAADLYFPGGHINPVDAATAQILTDAGYTTSKVFNL